MFALLITDAKLGTVAKSVKWKRKRREMIHKMRFAQANSSSTLSKRLTWNVSARAKMTLTPVVITVVEKMYFKYAS